MGAMGALVAPIQNKCNLNFTTSHFASQLYGCVWLVVCEASSLYGGL